MPDSVDTADPRRGSRHVDDLPGPAGATEPGTGPLLAPVPWPAPGTSAGSADTRVAGAPRAAGSAAPLVFDHVSKWYGPVLGVNQITLELRPGITGLVGGNGAGKSTLMKLATGVLRPDIGRVLVSGHDAGTSEARRHVGYCPDLDSMYEEMSGREFVTAMARLCGYSRQESRRRVEAALDLVGMTGRADRRVRGYSKGMRQRVRLAQAILHDPEVLVLDEPLSGIDPLGRKESIELFQTLAARGCCLLVSSHELDELEKLTDHVAVMARGRVAAVGTVARIRDLLDNHPLTVEVGCDQPRAVARAVLDLEDVVGVELHAPGRFRVRARNPHRFFAAFTRLVLEEGFAVTSLETLDDSTEAVLGYLLGGKRCEPRS